MQKISVDNYLSKENINLLGLLTILWILISYESRIEWLVGVRVTTYAHTLNFTVLSKHL